MKNYFLRILQFIPRFFIASQNLGFFSSINFFFFRISNKKLKKLKSKKIEKEIFYRPFGDYGAISHLYILNYKINDIFNLCNFKRQLF